MGASRSETVQKLVEDHYESLYRYAFRLSGAAADAEDLTQDVFCKAQMRLHQLRDAERVRPWLFAILRNAYLRCLRERRTAGAVSLQELGEWEPTGESPDPANDGFPEVSPERLQAVLNDLPEGYRTPLILYFFEEFSYRDIAEQMEVPIGTVMSRLSRAKAYLRNQLVPATEAPAAPGRGRRKDGL